MRVLQDEVRRNIWKSYFIMVFFILIISFLGFFIGYLLNSQLFGFLLALFAALIYSVIAYNTGESMVLRMSNAKPLAKHDFPFVWHTVEALSLAAGIPKPEVYIIESDALNAFATGKKPEKSYIALTTGIIKKLKRQELEGVIAHEISHIKNYDIRVMLITAVMSGIIVFLSQMIFRIAIFGGGRNRKSHPAILIVGLIFIILSPVFAEMIKLAVNRRREYLADSSGAVLTRYPPGLADALEKIKKDSHVLKSANGATAHLFISNPVKKKAKSFFSTHPPIEDRIKRLREM